MLQTALKYIVNELRNYLPTSGEPEVVMGNIALMDGEEQNELSDKIVVSLINIEEESTLKNGKHFIKEGTSIKYYNRPVHLNLYILFAANYRYDMYAKGLTNLSKVIEYFQSHKQITHLNSPIPGSSENETLELYMELFALTFEQVNYVWGSLGGKQVPFVLYKGRLVAIKADKQLQGGSQITEVQENEKAH